MIKQGLLGEFLHEAENTRKILKAIPNSALDWRPSEKNWTTAQLASHIAEVYNWYDATFNMDVFNMGAYQYDKGDISNIDHIVAKFEENVTKAQQVLENSDESTYFNEWKMEMDGNILFPPMPRIQVVRGFLYNHLYHHRGELVVYLRATGNKVPGLYGPTADDNM
ncbi:DinB family protein [Chryseobacterium defluvii]|uniref:Putative damage-inducible protein DinB n=1 Tax=Chryseobacterium defluvii TaxID=160396 RepID=A0A495SDQ8_9FLAO|nr:DinB family protein [Chryseobacterium defluvii]RKS98145.1 putative damage-inducible protein DinB [Chryseobacterium defluvii]